VSGIKEVSIKTSQIELAKFLKWCGAASTGGEARNLLAAGRVEVNGIIESRSGRTLSPGDRVSVDQGEPYLLSLSRGG